MQIQTRFIYGGIAGILAIAGLLVAANATEQNFYVGGLVLSGLALLFCWLLIKRHYDRWERDPARPRPAAPPWAQAPEEGDVTEEAARPTAVIRPGIEQPLAAPAGDQGLDPQISQWFKGVVVGIIGLLGLGVAASASTSGFAYWGGLAIFALAVLQLFRMIGRACDPPGASAPGLPVPLSGVRRWATGVVVGLVGLIALFVATGGGAFYYIGVMIAIAACAYIFYMMKVSYDEFEHHQKEPS